MIFVLDGPDGVGKTTLAQAFVDKLGAKYLHLTYRWKDRIFDYHTAALRFALRTGGPVVIDRWWPSEAVYAAAFRGGSTWPLQGRMCERVALKHGIIYIMCLPESVEAAVEQHSKLKEEREEMYDNIGDVARLYLDLYNGNIEHEDTGQYMDFLIRNGGMQQQPNVLKYTIGEYGHVMPWFVDRAVEISQDWRLLQYPPALLPGVHNVLGHAHTAQYVLVGEQVNPKHKRLYWPFYDYGHSSLYLTNVLHSIGLREEHIMYMNAFDHDGERNLHLMGLHDHKPSLRFIPLGAKAEQALKAMGVPSHAELPHPSYAKRFNKIDYLEIFKHAISRA